MPCDIHTSTQQGLPAALGIARGAGYRPRRWVSPAALGIARGAVAEVVWPRWYGRGGMAEVVRLSAAAGRVY